VCPQASGLGSTCDIGAHGVAYSVVTSAVLAGIAGGSGTGTAVALEYVTSQRPPVFPEKVCQRRDDPVITQLG